MIYGPISEGVVKGSRGRGTPLPAAFHNAPAPHTAYQESIVNAFDELSTCRPMGMGAICPIPWSAIHSYAGHLGILDDEVAYNDFLHHIRAMDEAWVKFRSEEQERESKRNGKPKGLSAEARGARGAGRGKR